MKAINKVKKQLKITKAQDISTYNKSYKDIEKCSNYMGSGIIIKIEDLGGNVIIDNTLIIDGLSENTIKQIKGDIRRSYELRISMNHI